MSCGKVPVSFDLPGGRGLRMSSQLKPVSAGTQPGLGFSGRQTGALTLSSCSVYSGCQGERDAACRQHEDRCTEPLGAGD